ncbi:dynein light chain [Musa troglodytarum]|uniref:Dynein light chain n=1 Tax=Musa troglodytarum TaxID=320322 RepID=A0A9E7HMZ6_9LILI|nr:dynein light chain [Musa troglodytarum]
MRGAAKKAASEELERRSQYLSSLVQREKEVVEERREKKKGVGDGGRCVGDVRDPPQGQQQQQKEEEMNVKVRAADMSPALQKHAFRCARETLTSMPKLESKRLALALKKEFDSTYGPAWHCIVGTSFGSYVTHSLGGFLYFSIDKVYILLFRTAVEPVDR